MNDTTPIATRPVDFALLTLMSAKREEIDKTCERFVAIGDPESLHDLRVALRRLHSLFIGFTPCFSPDNPLPRSLRLLLRETNHARDLEVALALLERQHLTLPWLQRQWQDDLEAQYRRLRQQLPPVWLTLSQQFDDPATIPAVPPPAMTLGMTLGRFAAGELGDQAGTLRKYLKRVSRQWNEKRAHKLRIRGKRIRYLLEPLAGGLPGVGKAVARLKRFQDEFGDYHDLVVLIDRLKRLQRTANLNRYEALAESVKQLKQRRRQLRHAIRHDYRGTEKRKLRKAMRVAQRQLAAT